MTAPNLRNRLPFAEAMQRVRLSRQRMLASDLNGSAYAWRVWAVCTELVGTYSKTSDRVHVRTIASMAGIKRPDKVSPILRQFDAEGIYIWRKDAGTWSPGFLALPAWREPELEQIAPLTDPRGKPPDGWDSWKDHDAFYGTPDTDT